MIINDKGLIYLNETTMTAIFDCVYGINDYLKPETKQLLNEKMFQDFVNLLLVQQNYNYWYRQGIAAELFSLFESTVGPMERNSDGTILWLALGLAIKELYGLRYSTLKELLKKVNVRK
ncbi:hypothetical protein [Peribacillus glennii]|uniref:Uncharacterized protein n=1 Tax=Peribacillus glennii TaxID=2303991 RepID=A0A372L8X1_9BACI|nr:hypothetical protein [Peribacillus glennii]RFU61974.1 hypothetical protein D0466_15375 [Peribacillus glennii]